MAEKRDQSTLFELIRPPSKAKAERIRVPDWAKPRSPEQQAAQHGQRSVSASTAAVEGDDDLVAEIIDDDDLSAQVITTTDERGYQNMRLWLSVPTNFALPRWMMVLAILVLGWVFVLVFQAGKRAGVSNAHSQIAAAQPQHHDAATPDGHTRNTLAGLRDEPIDPTLIPAHVPRVGETAPRPPRDAPADMATIRNRPIVSRADQDPRTPGLHYFRLAEIPARTQPDGERMIRFLRSHGVDVTMIPHKNGRSLVIYVLPGFSSPRDAQAQAFRSRLIELGQKWKSQGGATDWAETYAPRYTPSN